MSRAPIENKISAFIGGCVAEQMVFGEVTTGESNDIEQAANAFIGQKVVAEVETQHEMAEQLLRSHMDKLHELT